MERGADFLIRPATLGALLLMVATLVGRSAAQAASSEAEVTIFAAASLGSAFQEIGTVFERAHPGTRVRFNFAGSQQLATQLEHGARADLFAPADDRWMTYLAERELLAGPPRIFAHNRMVAILPRGNPAGIAGLEDFARAGLKLVVAAEAVPAGRYARQALANLALVRGFPADYLQRAVANIVSEEENVKAVVAKVQLGEADAGIVYASDVTGALASDLRVLPIPTPQNVLADYPLAVLRDARAPAAAAAFADLVLGPGGQQTLQRHGLIPAAARAETLAPATR